MPIEARSRPSSKPLTPALSSNLRSRPGQQPALTPRLATSTLTASTAIPTTSHSIPSRVLRQRALSPIEKEDANTVTLNSNVTPRSGARVSRLETESPSTPESSVGHRSSAYFKVDEQGSARSHSGLVSPNQTPTHARPRSKDQLSFLPTANGRRISGGSTASTASKQDSKFFRADDVKTLSNGTKSYPPRPRTIHVANLSPSTTRPSPDKAEGVAADRLDAKFFHASSVPRVGQNSDPSPPFVSPSTTSLPSDALLSLASPLDGDESSDGIASAVTVPRRPSTTISATSSTQDRRRSSSFNVRPIAAGFGGSHQKSLSTSSAAICPSNSIAETGIGKLSSSPEQLQINGSSENVGLGLALSPKSQGTISVAMNDSDGASPNATTAARNRTSLSTDAQPVSRPPLRPRHTRGSSEATAIQAVTKEQLEAAANARRERKVLDLEISNSSLLAINRTLEKELRKQSSELRRFRRLSRSGRLSYTPSNRIVSGGSISTLATLDEGGQGVNGPIASLPGSDEDGLEDDDDFYDEDGDMSDDASSALTESSELMRRRARDEKRLLQDLRRHQQILLDSQKLSQAIQRCLNFSEEMIKDGQKALAYQVEANEVQIGGRVLHHDDDEALSEVDFDEYREGMPQPRQGLLSPSLERSALDEARSWDLTSEAPLELEQNDVVSSAAYRTTSPSPTMELSPVILPIK